MGVMTFGNPNAAVPSEPPQTPGQLGQLLSSLAAGGGGGAAAPAAAGPTGPPVGGFGPLVQQGTPTAAPGSDQYNVGKAIATLFSGGTPEQPAAPAPPPNNTYDKWGHIISGSPAGQVAPAAAPAVPSLNTAPAAASPAPGGFGSSGYDMWGRQAPPPVAAPAQQTPGLGDLLAALLAASQKNQQPLPSLLYDHEGGSGGGEGAGDTSAESEGAGAAEGGSGSEDR